MNNRQLIIIGILEKTFDLYAQYSIKLPEKYWLKYLEKMQKRKDIDAVYIDTYINREDNGYYIYHSFSLMYKDAPAGAYVNMKINTIDTFENIEIINLGGNVVLTIK